jgi:hypothetical protein
MTIAAAALLTGVHISASQPVVPAGNGQLTSEPVWFKAGIDELGHQIEYYGQASQSGKIILTPSNGFFSRGIRAVGESKVKDVANGQQTPGAKGHPPLIDNDYGQLIGWNKAEQTMRWHVWFSQAGAAYANTKLEGLNPSAVVTLSWNKQTRRLTGEQVTRPIELAVEAAGKYTLQLSAEVPPRKEVARLNSIDLYGPAVSSARLLRARWRPAAIHGGYRCSKINHPIAWVMTSKNVSPTNSYSPITTSFGYFGNSFGADQRAQPFVNFSMWSKPEKPMEQQSHLIAVGSPRAEFSGFGHEGTGVKPSGWHPLHARPTEAVLALRVERDGPYNTYYGYVFDESTGDWQFYCAGRKWVGTTKSKPIWPGSFVEVVGSSARQRSGDVTRTVVRKGWAMDANKNWHQMDSLRAGKATRANKAWGVTSDGWFSFKMGGMEHFTSEKSDIQLPTSARSGILPPYLSPEKAKQLFALPVTFGPISAAPGNNHCTINLDLKEAGTNATATVYYGQSDFLTYAPRKRAGVESRSSVLDGDRFWPQQSKAVPATTGKNALSISGLKPGSTYFYRILVHNEQGKMWTLTTGTFNTTR